jgi:hypothetical protein
MLLGDHFKRIFRSDNVVSLLKCTILKARSHFIDSLFLKSSDKVASSALQCTCISMSWPMSVFRVLARVRVHDHVNVLVRVHVSVHAQVFMQHGHDHKHKHEPEHVCTWTRRCICHWAWTEIWKQTWAWTCKCIMDMDTNMKIAASSLQNLGFDYNNRFIAS